MEGGKSRFLDPFRSQDPKSSRGSGFFPLNVCWIKSKSDCLVNITDNDTYTSTKNRLEQSDLLSDEIDPKTELYQYRKIFQGHPWISTITN
jgi:hypothetical protein